LYISGIALNEVCRTMDSSETYEKTLGATEPMVRRLLEEVVHLSEEMIP
jgi:hypothetical protein